MAQPPTGPLGSGQAAVPPESGDEGDNGSRSSCAAVLMAPTHMLAPILVSCA
jgi:hypothetical protein